MTDILMATMSFQKEVKFKINLALDNAAKYMR